MSGGRDAGPDDWAAVNDLFHRALERAPEARDLFLEEICKGRPDLRAEVASLLASHGVAGSFIERPATAMLAEALVGQSVGHYRVTALLGSGGMGVVYLAEDTRLGRQVALKALAPQFTDDPSRRERLRREARAAGGLNHRSIATVYALEEIDAHVYIVSEFVPGRTLREEMALGPLEPAEARTTGAAIAQALSVAHEHGIVHRDLKPENVMRTPDGTIKILDFGLARFRDDQPGLTLTGDGAVLGTPAYMSPEQIRGERVDGRSDLFSLGVMLYELLAGAHPFVSGDPASTIARILEAEPAPLGPAGEVAPLTAVISRCLRKQPQDRYPDARSVVADLAASDAPALPQAGSPPAEARGRDPARWWWQFHQIAASVAYLLLLVPLWYTRVTPPTTIDGVTFAAGLVAAVGAAVLRLHLWFAGRTYPEQLARQRAHSARWIRAADALYVLVLAAAGLRVLIVADQTPAGLLLIGASVAVLVTFAVIEPATTRAALDSADQR